ncbi:MAG: hypothetical protein AB1730_15200 [Myxococcota bacterium]
MATPFRQLCEQVLAAYRVALGAALPPKPQVARHWATPDELHWLALTTAGDGFHLAYSLGRLVDAPLVDGERHTSGFFRLTGAVFRGVDEAALLQAVAAQVPASADGPTRAFLGRVVAQLAVAQAALALEAALDALPLAAAPGFACHLSARADARFEAAPTPRLPGHAADRVRAALDATEPGLAARVLAVFDASEPSLLDAVRHLTVPRA